MSKVRCVAALLALALGALLPETAAAQRDRRDTEKDDVHLRNNCRLAAQVLETGHPHPHYGRAINLILPCEQSGATALANVWRTAREDRAELERLTYVSSAMRDQRVFTATVGALQDQTRPRLVRLAAMSVLTALADSVVQPFLDVLENPPPHHVLGTVLDFPITIGAEPLAADTPERVLTLFAGVATEDPDPVVQAAARYLHTGLLRRRALR
jgi:hypothetical protein